MAEIIQMLHSLVVQFTCSLVWHAIMLRELDFVLCTHTRCGTSVTPVSGVLAWCQRLAVAVKHGGAFWGIAGEVFGGRGELGQR
jgi:hypothetical protein